MDKKEKRTLSEEDICSNFITPSIISAGWNQQTQIRRQVTLAPGPIVVRGNLSSRNTKKKKFADYVLYWEKGVPLAVIEAKKNEFSVSHGMQQALGYADILQVPSAFSSNGDAFYSHNKVAEESEEYECEIPLDKFPSPDTLWKRYKKYRNIEDNEESIILEPYYDDGLGKAPRYYQTDAVNRTIEAVARGQKRLLLVMATGTGKTYTTFQIIWRLWKSKRVKRVLFLVDRNILADQTLVNDFKPFGSVMTKIKNRKIDPSYEIYLGLYQALTGPNEEDKIFKNVSRDFFDLIVIDECHRGSASEDSAWREILEYFSDAIQLGLTATPKETEYISNITYFGDPIYTYSLKQGIEDGFLAPYKVIRLDIDKDIDGWTPPEGMRDDLGREIEQREYNQKDMDRILVLNQRTKLVAKTVMEFLKQTDPYAKTIIFCEDIDHAERMRSAIVNSAGKIAIDNPKYVMRITGDSIEGKAELDNFIDPESKFPVIATTSELLTTGVDAKTCKLIVLDKTVNSMTTFKQIVGRGTRLEEDFKKYYFTIMDFKKATELFKDPDFDGEPVVIYNPKLGDPVVPPEEEYPLDDEKEEREGFVKYRVSSGVDVYITAQRIEYLDGEGKLVTESYRDYTRNKIRTEYSSLDDFIKKWDNSKKKQAIIDELKNHGIVLEELSKEVGKDYDDFDLICHIAYDMPPLTRKERVNNVKKRNYFTKYNDKAKAVLESLLDKYEDSGISSIENFKILQIKPFDSFGTPVEIINNIFGGKENYEKTIQELENEIFYKDSRDISA